MMVTMTKTTGEETSAPVAPLWLSPVERQAWLAAMSMMFLLPAELDGQLQRDSQLHLYEYFVLSRLSMAADRTLRMSQLADVTNGSLSRLSNVAKRLESRGWIRREADPDDGRCTNAQLTDAGLEQVVAAAPGHVAAARRALIDVLSPAQLIQLGDIGRTVIDGLRRDGRPDPLQRDLLPK